MSVKDLLFGPDATTGSVDVPSQSDLGGLRQGAIPLTRPELRQRTSIRDMLLADGIPQAKPVGGVTAGDYGRSLAITMGDFAKAPVGALENLVGQAAGDESSVAERNLAGSQRQLGDIRRSIGEWQKGFFGSMSPEALDRAQRELLTLDPNKTIWQGGVGEFMSSLALKGTLSLGPTIGPMITTALLSRMGVGAAASTLYGAQEGLVSAGLTAAQIADNIEQTPLDELRKVQSFRTLEAQVGETEARRQFVNQVQGMVPAATGLLVGSIAKLVGKPLDTLFGTGKGLPFGKRITAGATTEMMQEGPQSFSEQVLQNYAEMAYNSDINLLDGAAEQTLQGMLLGGIMGGTFAGAFGNRPKNRALTGDPIPADIRAAISNVGGPSPSASPPTGGIPAQSQGGVPPGPPAAAAIPAGPTAPPDLVATPGAGIPLVNRLSARPRLDEQVQGIPFEPPVDTWRQQPSPYFPTSDVVDFPQPEPPLVVAPYKPGKVKAPKSALPLTLEDPFYVPDVEPDLSPLEQAAEQEPVWDPNAVELSPLPELKLTEAQPEQSAGYDVNQTREPKRGLRPTKDGLKAIGGPTTTARLGYRVRVRGPNGELLSSELIENHTRARLRAHQLERSLAGTNDGRYVEMLPARRTFEAERQPTPEPASDVLAQVRDMQSRDALDMRIDPDARRGVYLTRGTLEHLRDAGQLDEVLKSGVPIRNFDTYGGIMLAKDEETALELMQSIEDEKSDIDEVIGYATGAGSRKPGGNNPVVQLLDNDRNVIRERQVKPEEAEATRRQWGDLARILPLEQALAIRQNRLQKEKAGLAATRKEQEYAATQPEKQVQEIFEESPMTVDSAKEAAELAKQGGLEEDIGLRLYELAQNVRAKALADRKIDRRIPDPKEVYFHGQKVVAQRQELTRKRRRLSEAGDKVERLKATHKEVEAGLKAARKEEGEEAKKEVVKRINESQQYARQIGALEREIEQLTAELKSVGKSEAGTKAKLEALHAEYRGLVGDLESAAIRVEMARKGGSRQEVDEAEEAYEQLVSKILTFYNLEGGYTQSEAYAKAAHRFSPKGTKEVLRIAARERQKRREQKEQEASGTPARVYDSKDVTRAAQDEKVSVRTAAAKLSRMRPKQTSEERAQLAGTLYRWLAPMGEYDLSQLAGGVQHGRKQKSSAKTIKGVIQFNRLKKEQAHAAGEAELQARAEISSALVEVNQLLRQWLSDYRLALRFGVPAQATLTGRQRKKVALDRHVALITETLGKLRAYSPGERLLAKSAADYVAIRISDLVANGKRYGVSAEMDVDGFWAAVGKGPVAFRDYLATTVQTRDDVPFPIDVTEEELKDLPLASLDVLYAEAQKYQDYKRATNYYRRAMIKELMAAATARGINLQGSKTDYMVEVWNPNIRAYEPKPLTMTPRQFFKRLFTHSYGMRGVSQSMETGQLEYLYQHGGTITIIKKNGKRVEVPVRSLEEALPELPSHAKPARELEPGEKREIILRVAHAIQAQQHRDDTGTRSGGKLDPTPFVRELPRSTLRPADLKYNVNVLLEDAKPRDLGSKDAEYEEKRTAALANLADSLSGVEQYLALINTSEFEAEAGNPTALVHAKAYVRWLYEYGVSLSKASLKSWAAFEEMSRVALDLHELTSLKAKNFIEQVAPKFDRIIDVQARAAAKLDPEHLGGLVTPDRRAEMLAASHKRLFSMLRTSKRMSELWPTHPYYAQYIAPVLRKISDSVQRDGWPSYVPTTEEQTQVRVVLSAWERAGENPALAELTSQEWGLTSKQLKEEFYKPLNELLADAGFFDRETALMKQYQYKVRIGDRLDTDPRLSRVASEASKRVRQTEVTSKEEKTALRNALVAATVRKLRAANTAITKFREVLNDPKSTIQQTAMEEATMISVLRGVGFWKQRGLGMGTIALPDTSELLDEIMTNQRRLRKMREKIDPEGWTYANKEREINESLTELHAQHAKKKLSAAEFRKQQAALMKELEEAEAQYMSSVGVSSVFSAAKAKQLSDLNNEIKASMQELEYLRMSMEGLGSVGSSAYRMIGPRLRKGKLTKAEARAAVKSKLKLFRVPWYGLEQDGVIAKATPPKLAFDISTMQGDYGKPSEAEHEAFISLRHLLEVSDEVTLGELLTVTSSKLGPDHKYQPLIRAVLKHAAHRRINIRLSMGLTAPNGQPVLGRVGLEGNTPVILLHGPAFSEIGFHPIKALHVILHEAVHAASTRAVVENPELMNALNSIRLLALDRLGGAHPYATSDVFEFVAEAYTNAEFQQALKSIKVTDVEVSSLWSKFVSWVRRVLGLDPQYDNLLDAVLSLQEQTFGPAPLDRATQRGVDRHSALAYTDVATPLAESALMQHKAVQDLMRGAAASKDKLREHGQGWRLKALTMRQIEQIFGRYFGFGTNALRKYVQAFERRNSFASELMETADVLSRRWSAVEENANGEGVELSRIMHDATVNGLHADKSSAEVLQELHSAKEPDEKKIAAAGRLAGKQDELHARFRALSPTAQQLYRDVRDYYRATQKLEVQLLLANALRASKLWNGEEIDAESIDLESVSKGQWLEQKLGIDTDALKEAVRQGRLALQTDKETLTKEEFRKRRKELKAQSADLENTLEELQLISRMASIPMIHSGPYFPLMRFGDYAVKAERRIASEVYETRQERAAAMERWHEQDPTLQFSYPPTEEKNFPLDVSEVEFRLAETYTEAQAAREELLQEYEGGTVTSPHLRQALLSEAATIGSNSALQTLLSRLEGNAAAQAAIREFYIKSLSDRSFRKREAHRKNYRGADPTQQHRTFGAYAKSASYFTSQLKYGHVMAAAKAEMVKVAKEHNDSPEISGVQMDQIVQEIDIRDKQAATITDVRPVVRKMVETGQVWLLLSPSYWMVNATQPYMVTLPWLAARSSPGIAMKALKDAQSLIIDPLVQKGASSWGGLKAFKSRYEAEKAFSVMEDVTDTLKKKLGDDGAKPILDMLTVLKRESIIDLSFIAELRNVAAGEKRTSWDKVMDASRVMAHLTEVNNRTLTAIAAYNISKQKHLAADKAGAARMTPAEIEDNAIRFAKNAVAETQFDYSALNKARLFSVMDAWWKPVVFQFMQYVQHMYVLFFRHLGMWWRSPAGTPDKEVGRKVVLGLLLTHVAAGGLLGATPQIAKWALGLFMILFGAGDDDDQTFKNWVSGEYYDRMTGDALNWMLGGGKVAETARSGLPRLAGFDLSNRMAFLQTYMIDLDARTTETLYGSLITSFGGPMFGIAGNAFDAAELLLEGDADKAWEKLLPKLGRDVVRAKRFWSEGMTDYSGKTILKADEMSPWELFLTAVGFQPSQIAEVYSRNTRARETESFKDRRKADIMQAYRKSRSTGEIDTVMSDVREFNKQFPQDRITMSQLLRGLREMQKSEQNIQRYGVDAGRRSYEYAENSYNVE